MGHRRAGPLRQADEGLLLQRSEHRTSPTGAHDEPLLTDGGGCGLARCHAAVSAWRAGGVRPDAGEHLRRRGQVEGRDRRVGAHREEGGHPRRSHRQQGPIDPSPCLNHGSQMTRAVEGGHLPLPPWLTCVYAAPCPAAVRPADGPVGLLPGRGQHGAHVPRAQLLLMVRQQPRSECFIQSVSRVVLSAGTMNALVRYLWQGM